MISTSDDKVELGNTHLHSDVKKRSEANPTTPYAAQLPARARTSEAVGILKPPLMMRCRWNPSLISLLGSNNGDCVCVCPRPVSTQLSLLTLQLSMFVLSKISIEPRSRIFVKDFRDFINVDKFPYLLDIFYNFFILRQIANMSEHCYTRYISNLLNYLQLSVLDSIACWLPNKGLRVP